MPRKAPVTVFEHRLTLGNYERDQLKQIVNAKETQLYLQPFSSVMPVIVGGVGGYFGLAYLMDWWPFEPKPWSAIDWANEKALTIYENPDILNNAEAEALKRVDDRNAEYVQWLADNPSPTAIIDSMRAKGYRAYTGAYAEMRQGIVDKYAKQRIEWAAKAEAIRAKEAKDEK